MGTVIPNETDLEQAALFMSFDEAAVEVVAFIFQAFGTEQCLLDGGVHLVDALLVNRVLRARLAQLGTEL